MYIAHTCTCTFLLWHGATQCTNGTSHHCGRESGKRWGGRWGGSTWESGFTLVSKSHLILSFYRYYLKRFMSWSYTSNTSRPQTLTLSASTLLVFRVHFVLFKISLSVCLSVCLSCLLSLIPLLSERFSFQSSLNPASARCITARFLCCVCQQLHPSHSWSSIQIKLNIPTCQYQ